MEPKSSEVKEDDEDVEEEELNCFLPSIFCLPRSFKQSEGFVLCKDKNTKKH